MSYSFDSSKRDGIAARYEAKRPDCRKRSMGGNRPARRSLKPRVIPTPHPRGEMLMNNQDKNRMGGQHSGEEKKDQAGRPGQQQQGNLDNRDRKDDMRRSPQGGQQQGGGGQQGGDKQRDQR
jgi:hypothetical protein